MPDDDEVDASLDDASLDKAQLDHLVEHLEAIEGASRESALESMASFELWITSHPALRQMPIVESISQIGPAILRFLRMMLGLEKPGDDTTRQ